MEFQAKYLRGKISILRTCGGKEKVVEFDVPPDWEGIGEIDKELICTVLNYRFTGKTEKENW